MRKYKISQIPVVDVNGFVGSVDESDLFKVLFRIKILKTTNSRSNVETVSNLKIGTPVEEVSKLINKDNQAVLIDLGNVNITLLPNMILSVQ